MGKKDTLKREKDPLKTILAAKIAEKRGLTKRHVYLILSGDRNNPEIFEEYMTGREGLVEAVKQLISF